jgi:hypothetical protein
MKISSKVVIHYLLVNEMTEDIPALDNGIPIILIRSWSKGMGFEPMAAGQGYSC